MSGWTLFLITIGAGTATSWLFRVIEWIES